MRRIWVLATILSVTIILVGIWIQISTYQSIRVTSSTPKFAPKSVEVNFRKDSDEGGVSDFNEVYTYSNMNPNDSSDDKAFLLELPNVTAKQWDQTFLESYLGGFSFYDIVNISMPDPLLQWYANHTTVDPSKGLSIDGGQVLKKYEYQDVYRFQQPSFFLTHGRIGDCKVAMTILVLLKLKGYKAIYVTGQPEWAQNTFESHAWVEAILNDGKVHVLSENVIYLYTSHFYKDWSNMRVGSIKGDWNDQREIALLKSQTID